MKFGLIPEFIGRLPVMATLELLDEPTLISILTQPKNALIKQYQRLLELDEVELEVTEDALSAIALLAIERRTGARGLRSIIEHIMLDVMYEVPTREDVIKCKITADVVNEKAQPILILNDGSEVAMA